MRAAKRNALVGLVACLAPLPAPAAMRFAPEFIRMDGNLFGLAIGHDVRTLTPSNGYRISTMPLAAAFPPDWDRYVTDGALLDSVDSGLSRIKARAEVQARAEFGSLSALATARAENELARADATTVLQFMDVLTVDDAQGTGLMFGFDFLGSVEYDTLAQQTQFPSFARSYGRAELFVWPYGTVPTAGQNWNFTYYAASQLTPENGRTYSVEGDSSFTPGAQYWVVGRAEVGAVASTNGLANLIAPHWVEATADFSHTFNLYIDPAPGTTGTGYTMASGFDYRTPAPVPLPVAAGLLASALVTLAPAAARRRRGQNVGASRDEPPAWRRPTGGAAGGRGRRTYG